MYDKPLRHPAALDGARRIDYLYTLRGHKLRFLSPHLDPLPEGGRDAGNRSL